MYFHGWLVYVWQMYKVDAEKLSAVGHPGFQNNYLFWNDHYRTNFFVSAISQKYSDKILNKNIKNLKNCEF